MSWNRDKEPREEDDGEEEIDENEYKAQKDAVIFAIHVSESMLAIPRVASQSKRADEDSAVMAALRSASQLMQQRIIAQPRDMMSILFFGTAKSKFRDQVGDQSGYPKCYLHTDLDIPSAETVTRLKDLAETGDDPEGILSPAKPATMSIHHMLFCANQIFTTNAPNFGSRRLFIVTDNDEPCMGDKQERERAAVRAKDLFDLGVIIELFPVSRGEDHFDLNKFYTDIVYRDPLAVTDPENQDAIKTLKSGDGISLLNSMISSINSKQTPKRAYLSQLPFHVAPGLTISVNAYFLTMRQLPERSCYVWIEGERPQIAQVEVVKVEDRSMRTVDKTEVKKAYRFGTGGDFVFFKPEELEQVKKLDEKCLRIIGFKSRSMLPPWAAVKKSIFIFPTEAGYTGSTRVFSALWQKLLDSNKMGIAWFIARKNADPRIVAILPSKATVDTDSRANYPPAGLWLYPLPFADDARDLDSLKKNVPVKASNELIDQMRKIVENLQMPKGKYDPSKYPNPSLQWHYKVLQSLALDEANLCEDKPDLTVPKYRQINKRVGEYQVDFMEKLKLEAIAVQQQLAIKREANEESDERPKKKIKAAPRPPAVPTGRTTVASLRAAIDDGTLRKKTVIELRAICAEKVLGATTGKKKADLLQVIEEWVENQVP